MCPKYSIFCKISTTFIIHNHRYKSYNNSRIYIINIMRNNNNRHQRGKGSYPNLGRNREGYEDIDMEIAPQLRKAATLQREKGARNNRQSIMQFVESIPNIKCKTNKDKVSLLAKYIFMPYVQVVILPRKKTYTTRYVKLSTEKTSYNAEWLPRDQNKMIFKLPDNKRELKNVRILISAWNDDWGNLDTFIGGCILDYNDLIVTPGRVQIQSCQLYNKTGFRGELWIETLFDLEQNKLTVIIRKGLDLNSIINYVPIMSKQNVQLSVAILLMWIIITCIVQFIANDKWGILAIIYQVLNTVMTIGYGDYIPSTRGGKLTQSFIIIINNLLLMITLMNIISYYTEDKVAVTEHNEGFDDLENEFYGKKIIQENKEKSMIMNIIRPLLMFVFWFICWMLYWVVNDKTVIDSIYFSTVTVSTVGYGDVLPLDDLDRLFSVMTVIFGVISFVNLGSGIQNYIINRIANKRSKPKFGLSLYNFKQFKDMDKNNDGKIDEFEYLSTMIQSLHLVKQTDFNDIMKLFRQIDTKNKGYITFEDLAEKCIISNDIKRASIVIS